MSNQVFKNPVADFVALGQPYAKANSRVQSLNKKTGKMFSRKNDRALAYVSALQYQCPKVSPIITEEVWVHIKIWYGHPLNDLDESLILDAMQGFVYENDRQIKIKLIEHMGVDKDNPRAAIRVGII